MLNLKKKVRFPFLHTQDPDTDPGLARIRQDQDPKHWCWVWQISALLASLCLSTRSAVCYTSHIKIDGGCVVK